MVAAGCGGESGLSSWIRAVPAGLRGGSALGLLPE